MGSNPERNNVPNVPPPPKKAKLDNLNNNVQQTLTANAANMINGQTQWPAHGTINANATNMINALPQWSQLVQGTINANANAANMINARPQSAQGMINANANARHQLAQGTINANANAGNMINANANAGNMINARPQGPQLAQANHFLKFILRLSTQQQQLLLQQLQQQLQLQSGEILQAPDPLITEDNNVPKLANPVSAQASQADKLVTQQNLPSGLQSSNPLAAQQASMSTISPITAALKEDIVSAIIDGKEIKTSFDNFPYYLCDRVKHALVASFFLHTKHSDARSSRILLSGPAGSGIYQEDLSKALAHHFGAKFLVLGSSFFPAGKVDMNRSANACRTTPPQSEIKNQSLHRDNDLCQGPTTLKDYDKSIANTYLQVIASESRSSPMILFIKDVDKYILENAEAYLAMQYLINKLPDNVVLIGSQMHTENKTEKEGYLGRYDFYKKIPEIAKLLSELHCQKKVPEATKLSEIFPNKITIEMPKDETLIAGLKRQFSTDSERLRAEENITCLRNVLIQSHLDCDELGTLNIVDQTLTYEGAENVVKWALGYQLMEYPQNNANPKLVLSRRSMDYGINLLRETQKELTSSGKLLKDVVTENEFERNLLAEVIPPNETGVKFDGIGALENVKDTLKELVMLPLQRPELFCKGQLRKPCKGILLFGPPGTGKTMLAKAVATEAGANFINISMSSIASKWYGEAEKYVRAVFSLATKLAPSVIFVDEVDSLLGQRRDRDHEVTRRVKNEFMVNWDGLRTKDGERVLVLAATNRPFDLDDAVIRRMPRRFMVNLPDAPNRTKILEVILEKEELSPDVDIDAISAITDGYSGSDLKNLCITAAYCPVREILWKEKQEHAATVADIEPLSALKTSSESFDIRPISMEDFKYAREQISASYSTESMNMNQLLQWNEQYGEGGSRRETTLSYFL